MWPHENWESIDSHKETEVGGLKYISIDLPNEVSEDRNNDSALPQKQKWFQLDHNDSVFIVSRFGLRKSNFIFFAWWSVLETI